MGNDATLAVIWEFGYASGARASNSSKEVKCSYGVGTVKGTEFSKSLQGHDMNEIKDASLLETHAGDQHVKKQDNRTIVRPNT
jgi:hypothetical protein